MVYGTPSNSIGMRRYQIFFNITQKNKNQAHLDTLSLKVYFLQIPSSNGSIRYMVRKMMPRHFQLLMPLFLTPQI